MYDSIIIGSGPAGLTAAIYLLRAGKKVLILEKEGIGGAIASSPLVENYPGYISISGAELTSNMFDQADNLGVDLEMETVTKIEDGKIKKVITYENTYETRTIIIASGSKYRTLGLENEDNLIGNGLHFCVTCDGSFYKDKVVAIVGGGNSACVNAISMAKIAKKIYVIQNIDRLTAEESLKKELLTKSNVEIILNANVIKYLGDKEVKGLVIKQDNQEKEILVDGIFLSIGLKPQNDFAKDLLKINPQGYIESNDCQTSIEGIYVAGDTRTKRNRQVTTAVSDGTDAALMAIDYLNKG